MDVGELIQKLKQYDPYETVYREDNEGRFEVTAVDDSNGVTID